MVIYQPFILAGYAILALAWWLGDAPWWVPVGAFLLTTKYQTWFWLPKTKRKFKAMARQHEAELLDKLTRSASEQLPN